MVNNLLSKSLTLLVRKEVRRLFIQRTIFHAITLLCVNFFSIASAQVDPRPNIIFLVTDDHSWPDLGIYGEKGLVTPNMDKLGASGAIFNRAYVSAPQCAQSRSSFFTGRSPILSQLARFGQPLTPDIPTGLENLKQAGYYTAFIGRTHHQDGASNEDFLALFPELPEMTEKNLSSRFDLALHCPQTKVVETLQGMLDCKPTDHPLYLFLGFNDPHRPFIDPKTKGPFITHTDPNSITMRPDMPDVPEQREDLAQYYDALNRLDDVIGKCLERIDKKLDSKNTLVILMGDNGRSFLRGKGALYELGIRVPLLVRYPSKIEAGQKFDQLISGEDIMPTILDAAGIKPPGYMTGHSFYPLLTHQEYKSQEYIFSSRGSHAKAGISWEPDLIRSLNAFDLGRAVISQKYSLIYNVIGGAPYRPLSEHEQFDLMKNLHQSKSLTPSLEELYFSDPMKRPAFEFYDLEKDPFQMQNLSSDKTYTDEIEKHKMALFKWIILNRDFVPLPKMRDPLPKSNRPRPRQW